MSEEFHSAWSDPHPQDGGLWSASSGDLPDAWVYRVYFRYNEDGTWETSICRIPGDFLPRARRWIVQNRNVWWNRKFVVVYAESEAAAIEELTR